MEDGLAVAAGDVAAVERDHVQVRGEVQVARAALDDGEEAALRADGCCARTRPRRLGRSPGARRIAIQDAFRGGGTTGEVRRIDVVLGPDNASPSFCRIQALLEASIPGGCWCPRTTKPGRT